MLEVACRARVIGEDAGGFAQCLNLIGSSRHEGRASEWHVRLICAAWDWNWLSPVRGGDKSVAGVVPAAAGILVCDANINPGSSDLSHVVLGSSFKVQSGFPSSPWHHDSAERRWGALATLLHTAHTGRAGLIECPQPWLSWIGYGLDGHHFYFIKSGSSSEVFDRELDAHPHPESVGMQWKHDRCERGGIDQIDSAILNAYPWQFALLSDIASSLGLGGKCVCSLGLSESSFRKSPHALRLSGGSGGEILRGADKGCCLIGGLLAARLHEGKRVLGDFRGNSSGIHRVLRNTGLIGRDEGQDAGCHSKRAIENKLKIAAYLLRALLFGAVPFSVLRRTVYDKSTVRAGLMFVAALIGIVVVQVCGYLIALFSF